MFSLLESRPAEGTWVYWIAVEQCSGRINSGLSKWKQKDYDALTEDGLVSFWVKGDDVAFAHLEGRRVELDQQMEDNKEQYENLKALYQIAEESLKELGA